MKADLHIVPGLKQDRLSENGKDSRALKHIKGQCAIFY